MKKVFSVTIFFLLMLSLFLVGCSETSEGGTSRSITSAVPTQLPSKSISTSTLGDYEVVIKDAEIAEDYEGKPVVIISFDWTNNSENTVASAYAVMMKAFQDGVELDPAIVIDSDIYDSSNYLKEVRPGTTIEVQRAFILPSETSVIEIEVTEWIALDDSLVYATFDPVTKTLSF